MALRQSIADMISHFWSGSNQADIPPYQSSTTPIFAVSPMRRFPQIDFLLLRVIGVGVSKIPNMTCAHSGVTLRDRMVSLMQSRIRAFADFTESAGGATYSVKISATSVTQEPVYLSNSGRMYRFETISQAKVSDSLSPKIDSRVDRRSPCNLLGFSGGASDLRSFIVFSGFLDFIDEGAAR